MRRQAYTRLVCWFCFVAISTVVPEALAQGLPGKTIPLDLSADGTILKEGLPFDVPFMFTGAAEGIEAIFYGHDGEHREPINNCGIGPAKIEPDKPIVAIPPSPSPPDMKTSSVANLERWYCPSAKCKEFQLTVRKLNANRFYCFRFLVVRRLDPDSPTRLMVAAAVERWTREALKADISTPEHLEPLRQEVLTAIREAAAARNLVVLPDSLLGDVSRFGKAFQSAVQAILSAHRQTAGVDAQLAKQASQLTLDINTRWLETDFIRSLFDRIDASKADSGLAASVAAVGKLRTFLQQPASLPFALQGLPFSTSGPPSLEGVLTSQGRAAARARLTEEVVAPFEELLRLLLRLPNDKALRTTLNVTDAEIVTAREIAPVLAEQISILRLVGGEIESTEDALARREQEIQNVAALIAVAEGVGSLGSTVGDFNTRKTWYISMDLGVAVAPTLDTVFPYAGMNIYFSPVNKDAPLNTVGFSKRFAAMVGVTYATGSETITFSDVTEPVLDNRTVIVGAGYRVLDSLRVTGGGVLLRERDPNPLLDQSRLVMSPFFGISIDWNIKDSFLDKMFGLQ